MASLSSLALNTPVHNKFLPEQGEVESCFPVDQGLGVSYLR